MNKNETNDYVSYDENKGNKSMHEIIRSRKIIKKSNYKLMIKGCWNVLEDKMIINHVKLNGPREWSFLAK